MKCFLGVGPTSDRNTCGEEPALSEYEQFYVAYGECFSIWSSVEGRLLFIYLFLLGSPEHKCASSAFYSTTGFRAKLEIVDAVVSNSKKITTEDAEKWCNLNKEVSKKSKMRNKLAHNTIFFGRQSDTGEKKLFLGNPNKPFEDSRFYYHDLTSIKKSFLEIDQKLVSFWFGLLPKPQDARE